MGIVVKVVVGEEVMMTVNGDSRGDSNGAGDCDGEDQGSDGGASGDGNEGDTGHG